MSQNEDSNRSPNIASDAMPVRRFAWSDMFVHPDEDPRIDGGFEGERATLVGYLRNQRLTLELKCSGLDASELARRSVEPSNPSLLGLVRHLAEVERGWFRRRLAGQDAPPLYRTDDDADADFNGALLDPDLVEEAWKNWRDEVAFAERFVDEASDLDLIGEEGDYLRDVLVHMIEETLATSGTPTFCVSGSTAGSARGSSFPGNGPGRPACEKA